MFIMEGVLLRKRERKLLTCDLWEQSAVTSLFTRWCEVSAVLNTVIFHSIQLMRVGTGMRMCIGVKMDLYYE